MSEEILWKGRPSQLLNLGRFLLALLLAAGIGFGGLFFPPAWFALAIPALWALWEFLRIRCRIYELTAERLRLYSGVLNQEIDELELYRVKDSSMIRPFWLRIFKLSNIRLETSDRSHPQVRLEAIGDATEVREKIRRQVEYWRDRKRVREVDFQDGDEFDDEVLP